MGNANGANSPRRKRAALAPESVVASHSDSSIHKKAGKKKDKDSDKPKKSSSLTDSQPPPSPSLATQPIDPEKLLFGVPLELSALR